ncbi:AAA family ATPase [Treponema sp.]|uniref:nucleotide-binding protein n=1 Tax=Treponema sp. TaxID=166 RepID=UPI00388F2E93
MRKIAIYGKGGIGKSTTCSNLSAALSKLGYKVMQVGCDPKSDSVKNLNGGKKIPTVLDMLRSSKAENLTLDDLVYKGFNGVLCVEAGGPTPGIGCAGRGIITAFEKLEELNAFEVYRPDIVIYDVLGDVVCGGFAMPIRNGYAEDVFIVTSGEMMALYAANNIVSAIKNFGQRGYAQYSGVILNSRNVKDEVEVVQKALDEIGGEIIQVVPRDGIVQQAENRGMTVVEAFPESEQAQVYMRLAEKVLASSTDREIEEVALEEEFAEEFA